MLKNFPSFIQRSFNCHRSLNFLIRKNYDRMSPEDYLYNQREASFAKKIHEKKLLPLPLSSMSNF